MSADREIAMIKKAVADEGRVEGNHVVVPADFFTRLNAELNPPQEKNILDILIEKLSQ